MPPPRLVLDTSVLVSALLFHAGSLSWLRAAWQSDSIIPPAIIPPAIIPPAIIPLASHDTTAELIRVLYYPKFRLTNDEREDLLADYLPWCESVTVADRADVPQCRDPFDRPFLELALAAKADALLTGDKDLLVMTETFPVPIRTPAAFRAGMAHSIGENGGGGV